MNSVFLQQRCKTSKVPLIETVLLCDDTSAGQIVNIINSK